jgi:hypothetical protein
MSFGCALVISKLQFSVECSVQHGLEQILKAQAAVGLTRSLALAIDHRFPQFDDYALGAAVVAVLLLVDRVLLFEPLGVLV